MTQSSLHQVFDRARASLEGQSGPPSDDEREILQHLGTAVVTLWADLPRDLQSRVFEAALAGGEPIDRTALARLLHDHYERTPGNAGGGRSSPASAVPPAGHHSRQGLINPDATPGSGLLPDANKTSGEVDSAAG